MFRYPNRNTEKIFLQETLWDTVSSIPGIHLMPSADKLRPRRSGTADSTPERATDEPERAAKKTLPEGGESHVR